MLKMIIFGLVALAALQVAHSKACEDDEHIVSPLDPHQPICPHHTAPPQCPSPCGCEGVSEAPWNYGCRCGYPCDLQPCIQPSPCPCNPCPCNPCAAEPCISSVTRVTNPCDCPHGPVLQSAVQSPLFPEPLVPVVENHVGHHLIKTIKHVPVVRKYCRPELVIRTRHVPVIKHRKRVFIEPYPSQIPITDKLIRQVIHEITHRLPVVHKCFKPYTFQTVRHVPLSRAQCIPGDSNAPCCCQFPDHSNYFNTPFSCNAPCPGDCDAHHP